MISSDTYAIVDTSAGGAVLGNVDSISAPELVYPGAVYLHEGKSYIVDSLDGQAKIAAVRPAEVDYYTQPVLSNHCRLFDASEQRPAAGRAAGVRAVRSDVADDGVPQVQVLHDGDDRPGRA